MNPSEVHVRSNVPRLVRGPRRRTRTSSIPRSDELDFPRRPPSLLYLSRRDAASGGAHGLVAPSSSFVASSRQGERAAVAQDAQSDQAEASPCDASPSSTTPTRGVAHRSRGTTLCGPTPRAPREDPRPRGARERALDPSSAHLAPRGGLRGTARVQHGPSDGTLLCVLVRLGTGGTRSRPSRRRSDAASS